MPRDINRIPRICKLLVDAWSYNQHLTFCALLKNVVFDLTVADQDIWFVEDNVIEKILHFEVVKDVLDQSKLSVINALESSWSKCPDQRLGQFVSNYGLFRFHHYKSVGNELIEYTYSDFQNISDADVTLILQKDQ